MPLTFLRRYSALMSVIWKPGPLNQSFVAMRGLTPEAQISRTTLQLSRLQVRGI